MAAAIVFTLIYGATIIAHTYQAIRCRAWYCIPIIIGASWETAGYAIRAAASHFPASVPIYAAQTILIVLAPACKPIWTAAAHVLVCSHEHFVLSMLIYLLLNYSHCSI